MTGHTVWDVYIVFPDLHINFYNALKKLHLLEHCYGTARNESSHTVYSNFDTEISTPTHYTQTPSVLLEKIAIWKMRVCDRYSHIDPHLAGKVLDLLCMNDLRSVDHRSEIGFFHFC